MTQCLDADSGGSLSAHTQLGPASGRGFSFKGTGRLRSKEWGFFLLGRCEIFRSIERQRCKDHAVGRSCNLPPNSAPPSPSGAFLDKRGRRDLVQLGECRIEFAQTNFRHGGRRRSLPRLTATAKPQQSRAVNSGGRHGDSRNGSGHAGMHGAPGAGNDLAIPGLADFSNLMV